MTFIGSERGSGPGMSEPSRNGSGWLLLGLMLLAALLAHVWMLDTRWIVPDEGAHLMDGKLVLDGLVPLVDFGARQPFYVYATAAVLEVFSVGYATGRILALISTLGAAVLVFLIGRDLFGRRVGLLASALFLFLPFPLFLSVYAKTEPLTILVGCGAMFCGVRAVRGGKGRAATCLYVAAGALVALGFYVRESSLAVLLALAIMLVVVRRNELGRLLRGAGWIGAGFVGVCMVVGALYVQRLPPSEVVALSTVNPVAFVSGNVRELAGAVERRRTAGPESTTDPVAEGRVGGQQEFRTTIYNVREAVRRNAVLLGGAVLYPLLLLVSGRVGSLRLRDAGAGEGSDSEGKGFAVLAMGAWSGGLAAAYLFWSLKRGFFPAYFLEFIPSLTILTAALAVESWRRLPGPAQRYRTIGALASLVVGMVGLHLLLGQSRLTISAYFFVPLVILSLFHLPLVQGGSRRVILYLAAICGLGAVAAVVGPGIPAVFALALYGSLAAVAYLLLFRMAGIQWTGQRVGAASFVFYTLFVGGLMLTLAESLPLARADSGLWPPETVSRVAHEIRQQTPPDAEVLSGALIWELQANRRPFMNISHPLGFQGRAREDVVPPIRDRLRSAPPSVVILDGYTEQTYLLAVPELRSLLDRCYRRTMVVDAGARYPVEVYLREARAGGQTTSPASPGCEQSATW